MSTTAWHVNGQYYESCSCDFICACVPSGLTIKPTKGDCTVAMAFHVEHGKYGNIPLDNLGFIVVARTPEAMGKGNWEVGVVVDEKANTEQRDAIGAIASGQAGGPMAAIGGLVGKFLGVQPAAIRFERHGEKWSVHAGNAVEISGEGARGINPNDHEPIHLDHTGHPPADRFALAHASKARIHTLGLSWEDLSGKNNAQYAPFSWRSA